MNYTKENLSKETLIVRLKKSSVMTSIVIGSSGTLVICFAAIYFKAYMMAVFSLVFFLLTLYHLIGDLKMATMTKETYIILTDEGIDFCYTKWLVVNRIYLLWSDISSLTISKTQPFEQPDCIYIETLYHSYKIVVLKAAVDKNVKEIYAFINKYSKPAYD